MSVLSLAGFKPAFYLPGANEFAIESSGMPDDAQCVLSTLLYIGMHFVHELIEPTSNSTATVLSSL